MKTTTVGIIGAGAIGQAFAEQLVKAGMNAILSNSRGPESLTAVVEKLGHGARAGTVEQAAQPTSFLSAQTGTKPRPRYAASTGRGVS